MITNKDLAECFREALGYLWDGTPVRPKKQYRNICYAIDETCFHFDIKEECCSIIRSRLGTYNVYAESWLINKGVPYKQVWDTVKMQAWRKQWLEQLVEEFENK